MRERTRVSNARRREIDDGLQDLVDAQDDQYALEMYVYYEWCDEQARMQSYEESYWQSLSYVSANWDPHMGEVSHG